MVDSFKSILADYRQSYLLQYTLTPAPHPGWHDLSVKINRPGKFDIRARRGYFVDTPSSR